MRSVLKKNKASNDKVSTLSGKKKTKTPFMLGTALSIAAVPSTKGILEVFFFFSALAAIDKLRCQLFFVLANTVCSVSIML